ncbi:MAG: hypothetical protein PHF37_02870 [Phycisphaerae bacterium]|nr:hypothetical protein [Phycisphaerae bacterium]
MKNLVLLSVAVILVLGLAGCGKKGVDASKPTAEVKAEAPTLSVDQLKAKVETYTKAIADKQVAIDKVMAKMKELDVTKMASEEGKKLKTEVDQITASLKTLRDHIEIYKGALEEKMKAVQTE